MSDIFAPFEPQPPGNGSAQTEPVMERPKRGPRKKKASAAKKTAKAKAPRKAKKVAPVAEATPAPRKPRAPARSPATRQVKVDLAVAMSALAGIKPEDAKLLSQIVTAMQALRAPSRKRIVGALGSIFA